MDDPLVFEDSPALTDPVVVMALQGWNDAGDAASTAAEFLRTTWAARRFASIDPEEFYDFQVSRPSVELVDGTTRRITWPDAEFLLARPGGRDVVLLTGGEPNLRWRTFCDTIVRACQKMGASTFVTLGAFLADVPHIRPVPIVGSASSTEEAERLRLAPSNYEGPTGIVGVAHDAAKRAGIESVSFWAAVPHYLPMGENPKAALALVGRLAEYLDIPVDVELLHARSVGWEEEVTEQIRENETLSGYVEQLAEQEQENTDISQVPSASGDEIAAEIERFLQDRGTQGDA